MGNGTMRAAAIAPRLQPNWWIAALVFGACACVTAQAQAASTVARFRVTVDMVTSCTLGAIGLPAHATEQIARLRIACSLPVAYSVALDAARSAQGGPYRSLAASSFVAPEAAAGSDGRTSAWRTFAIRKPDSSAGAAAGGYGEPAVGILVSY